MRGGCQNTPRLLDADGGWNNIGNFVNYKYIGKFSFLYVCISRLTFFRVWNLGRACCFTQTETHLTLNLSKAKSKVMESSGKVLYPIIIVMIGNLFSIFCRFSGSKCRVLFCRGYVPGSDLGKPLFSSRICIVTLSSE